MLAGDLRHSVLEVFAENSAQILAPIPAALRGARPPGLVGLTQAVSPLTQRTRCGCVRMCRTIVGIYIMEPGHPHVIGNGQKGRRGQGGERCFTSKGTC